MLYNWYTRTTILTPPKTASSSLHQQLCMHSGWFYVLSLAEWGTVTKHCSIAEAYSNRELEFEFHDKETKRYPKRYLLGVRNPATRIVSLYRHHVQYDTFRGTFRDWVRLQEDRGCAGKMWMRSCISHLSGNECAGYIRTEHLNDDLVSLGIPPCVSRMHVTPPMAEVDAEYAERVSREWWADDWEIYD